MQSCTWGLWYNVFYGRGKPDKPSQQAMKTSATPPVLQFDEHVEPELCAFVLLDLEAQEFLVAVQVDAQGQVVRLVPDAAAIT